MPPMPYQSHPPPNVTSTLISKRSVILDDEGNKSRRRLLIEKRVRRGYIGAKHRKTYRFNAFTVFA